MQNKSKIIWEGRVGGGGGGADVKRWPLQRNAAPKIQNKLCRENEIA